MMTIMVGSPNGFGEDSNGRAPKSLLRIALTVSLLGVGGLLFIVVAHVFLGRSWALEELVYDIGMGALVATAISTVVGL